MGGTIGRSGDYWRPQAKRKQSEREYYETIIGSHLQHDPDRRLRSSANQHHLVTGDFSPATTSTTTTSSAANSSGTVTDYTPGSAITLDPGTGKPVRFVISQRMIQVLGPDGKVMADADVKKNSRVQLHLVQEGNRTVVDKINVESSSSNY